MIQQQVKSIFRLAKKNKLAFITNITGFAIGLSTTVLLLVYIFYEFSYDSHFTNSNRVYRLNTVWIENGYKSLHPICLRSAFTEVPEQVAGIESAVQIYRGWSNGLKYKENVFHNNKLLYVDTSFFSVFDFKVLEGNAEGALENQNNLILTRKLAQNIFGNKPAVGNVLTMEDKSYVVSAVIEDVPLNTHFNFDFLLPVEAIEYLDELGGLEFFTYYLFDPNVDPEKVSGEISGTYSHLLTENFAEFNAEFDASLEPLNKLHLFSEASYDLSTQGNINTVIVVGIIALLIMILALTNFINLFILEGEQRAKEIGIRKVSGAGQKNLIRQFFTESTFVIFTSFAIALILSVIFLPAFGDLMQREFPYSLYRSPSFIISSVLVFLLTLLLSGSYPALILSKLTPNAILKSQTSELNRKKYVMNFASGFQLIITLILITVLFGINRQIRFLKNYSPGFNPDGLTNIYNLSNNLKEHYLSIRDNLLSLPEVVGISASSHIIGGGSSGQGIRLLEEPSDDIKAINEYRIQPGLCNLLELQLAEGRFFDPDRPNDRNAVVLNEATVRKLGLESAVGRKVVMFDNPLEVIGVVKDFNYESAARSIQPLILTSYSEDIDNIVVRISESANTSMVLKKIESVLKEFDTNYMLFHKETRNIYENYYADEKRLEQLTKLGTFLAVLIVMMGVFLLVSYNITRRTKEIGVRKVLGGSTYKMVALIYSNALKWTAFAAIIAMPVSYYCLTLWLQNYAVHDTLKWWIFVQGLIIILLLELAITFTKTWNAANRNPVEALRYE